MRKIFRLAALIGALVAAGLAQAQTSSYPDRPVRVIVAFVPGGATDTLARQISEDLGKALGQTIVVENRPGAGGYLAWNHVASADPDGYTLLLAENALGISQALYKKSKSPFDPLTQYDAVASIATSPSALILANNIPAKTVPELIAYSKTVPQKMNYASAGIGSVSHLNFEVFKDGIGMEAVHVPYKGGGQAIQDVVAGHVPMTISSVQATKSLVSVRHREGPRGDQPDALAGDAERSHHAGGRREEPRRRAAVLVRHFRPEGLAGARQGQDRAGGVVDNGGCQAARALGQARHHAGLSARPGAARAPGG